MQYHVGRVLIILGVSGTAAFGRFNSNQDFFWLQWFLYLLSIVALVFGLRFFAAGIKHEVAEEFRRDPADKVTAGGATGVQGSSNSSRPGN